MNRPGRSRTGGKLTIYSLTPWSHSYEHLLYTRLGSGRYLWEFCHELGDLIISPHLCHLNGHGVFTTSFWMRKGRPKSLWADLSHTSWGPSRTAPCLSPFTAQELLTATFRGSHRRLPSGLSTCIHLLLKSRHPEGRGQTAAGTLQNRRLCFLLFIPLKVIHFLCNKSKNTEVCKEFLHLFQTKLNSTRWPSSNLAFFLHCFPTQANCDKEIRRHYFFLSCEKAFLFMFATGCCFHGSFNGGVAAQFRATREIAGGKQVW